MLYFGGTGKRNLSLPLSCLVFRHVMNTQLIDSFAIQAEIQPFQLLLSLLIYYLLLPSDAAISAPTDPRSRHSKRPMSA